MSKIILQPCGNNDALNHYADTVENAVPLDDIQDLLGIEDYDKLREIYPEGLCYVWGVTPSTNNVARWDRVQRGDVSLFSGGGRIFGSGIVTFKIRNEALADRLWGYNDDNDTWEYIYFLDEIRRRDIPYLLFNRAVGYADNYVIQGFNVLNQEQSNSVFQVFDLESEVFVSEINEDVFQNIVLALDNLQDTDLHVTSLRRLEQGYLKRILFGLNTNGICACCKNELPISYLVTAHIKKRSYCTHRERVDKNVVMPMCKFGCDELFEKGYISVRQGFFTSMEKRPTTNCLENYISNVTENNPCHYFQPLSIPYFEWHLNQHS